MESINIITTATQLLITFTAVGTAFRCLYLGIAMVADGEDFTAILKKMKKKLYAMIMSACTVSLLQLIKSYYL